MRLLRLSLWAALAGLAFGLTSVYAESPAVSQKATPGDELHRQPVKRGWFWYIDPAEKQKKEEPPVITIVPPAATEQPKAPVVVIPTTEDEKKRCGEKATWSSDCGFIDPGDDFEFQAQQRDVLLQQMSIRPDSPDAVEAAQRYMKWAIGKASMAANMWYFNLVQKPDLDPTVKNPISEVGLALASKINDASQYEIFRLIREEGGVLFFFSRDDCAYCHDQAPYAQRVARTMGLQLINIPLDGKCLANFVGDDCGNNIKPEQLTILDLQTVPTMYLYVPSNTWIRLGTGLTSDATVLANTVNFFSAYRAAMLHGLDNSDGVRPSVTFDPAYNARPTGTVAADGSKQAGTPDRARMLELMGYSTANGEKAKSH